MSPSTKHFLRHHGEMVLGMAVLGLPTDWALSSVGADPHEYIHHHHAQVTA
jgi:hypothetical protein